MEHNISSPNLPLPLPGEATIAKWIRESKYDGNFITEDMVLAFAHRLYQDNDGDDGVLQVGNNWINGFLHRHPEIKSELRSPQSGSEPRQPSSPTKIQQMLQEKLRAKFPNEPSRKTLQVERGQGDRVPAAMPIGQVIFEGPCRRIIRHDGNLVTKVFDGMAVDKNEVAAMRFVAENTTIPVPRVVDADWDRITMTYVEGDTLKMAWPVLTELQRAGIIDQLRDYVAQLRAIPWPNDDTSLIGRLSGEGVVVPGVITRTGGPFQSVADLHEFLTTRGPSASTDQSMYWHQVTHHLGKDHPIVFSHGDIAARNIMVRDGRIAAIIDWEMAGWYPAYWDYYFAMCGLDNLDWQSLGRHIPSIFEKRFDLEYMSMHFVQSIN